MTPMISRLLRIWGLALIISLLMLPPAHASVRCEDLLRLPGVEKASIGQRFAVQTINSSNPLMARLTDVYRKDGSIIFNFDEGAQGAKYSLPVDQIFAAKPVPSRFSKISMPALDFSWDGIKKSAIRMLDTAYLSLEQYYGLLVPQLPMFNHAHSDRIKVGSMNPLANRAIPARIVEQLTEYDAHFEKLGFRIPDITKIIIQQNSLIPAPNPEFFLYPLLTIRRGCFKHVIKVMPTNHDRRYVTDRFVLFHERAHSFMFATYQSDSAINADIPVQEGLADFFAAHYLNTPRAEELANEDLRDIELRINKGVALTSILHLNGDAHSDGLFISNLLWKIRVQVGAPEMNKLLPLITDGFNRYKVNLVRFPKPAKNDGVWRVENFIAILRHIAKSSPLKLEINQTIDLYIAELSLDSNRLADMANAVHDSQDSSRATGPELRGVVFGLLTSSMGLTINGILLHLLTKLM